MGGPVSRSYLKTGGRLPVFAGSEFAWCAGGNDDAITSEPISRYCDPLLARRKDILAHLLANAQG